MLKSFAKIEEAIFSKQLIFLDVHKSLLSKLPDVLTPIADKEAAGGLEFPFSVF